MADDWKAGLTDQDELSQFPSAASPLTAMGIDPDTVRGNPDLLNQLTRAGGATHTSVPSAPNLGGSGRTNSWGGPYDQTEALKDTLRGMPVDRSGAGIGVPDTSNAAVSSGAAAPQPQPEDLGATGRKGLGLLTQNLESATKAAGDVPTKEPEEITTLEQTRGKLATPAPRFDTATGKPLTQTQEYDPTTGQEITLNPKASTGRKIWRGVRGGLVGFLTGGIPGAAVGALEPQDIRGGEAYNAPSPAYQKAEQRREQELAATDTSLASAQKNWADAVKAAQAKASEYRANATTGKDIVTGATGLMNAENKPETEDQKAKAKIKLSQAEFDQRNQQLQTDPQLSKLSPLNKALYLANGKVPDPREPNEAEINAAQIARGMVIFKAQHGGRGPQTLEEFNSVISASKGDLGKGAGKTEPTEQQLKAVEDKKDDAVKKANEEYAKHLYMPGAKEQYQRQLQAIQDQYESDMSIFNRAGAHNVVSVDPKGKVTWTPQAAPTPAPVAPPAPAAQPAGGPAAPPNPTAPANKPAPAPDGARIKLANGTIQVKRNGKWVNE